MSDHCYTHGRSFPDGSECPECRAERTEELIQSIRDSVSNNTDVEDRLSAIQETLETMAYKQANPGDYQCPHCRRQSLEYDADVCPVCHKDVEWEYWERVHEVEKARAAAEKQRREEEAARLKKEAEEKERRETEASAASAKEAFVLLCLAALVVLVLWACGAFNVHRQENAEVALPPATKDAVPANPTPQISYAPEQLIQTGPCSEGYCGHDKQRSFKKHMYIYRELPDFVDADSSLLQSSGFIPAGEVFILKTLAVITKQHLGRIGKETRYVDGTNGPGLVEGQPISLYGSMSDGCWTAWIKGEYYSVCGVTLLDDPQSEMWLQVELTDGSSGWIKISSTLASQQKLNQELGGKIAELNLALHDKLKNIDELLADGASLNGDAGRYVKSPMEMAIGANDVDLLRELVQRGLDLKSSMFCTAGFATRYALQPRGDLTLEFLLENGMRLDCLQNPPLEEFLIQNPVPAGTYPVAQAVKVAEMLIRHGVNIEQRNSQGQSIFDLLNAEDMALRPEMNELKEALTELVTKPDTEKVVPK